MGYSAHVLRLLGVSQAFLHYIVPIYHDHTQAGSDMRSLVFAACEFLFVFAHGSPLAIVFVICNAVMLEKSLHLETAVERVKITGVNRVYFALLCRRRLKYLLRETRKNIQDNPQ